MREAIYSITIDGTNVSSAFNPLLLSLEIDLTDGGETDRLTIELDDTDGQIQLPRVGATISASLGWSNSGSVVSFEGFTDEPKSGGTVQPPSEEDGNIEQLVSGGSRGSGRTLTITAHSADMTSAIKQPMQAHADAMTFGDVAKQWAQKAGLSDVAVSDVLSSIQRPYWAIANESFMGWGARIAKELGATFKIMGGTGVFVPRSGGASASGKTLTTIAVTWGVNLISWSIAPVLSRANFGTFAARHYDPIAATWKMVTAAGAGGSDVTHTDRFAAPDQDSAQQKAGSNGAESKRDRGGADTVTIDGEPDAQPDASSTVSGVRPGVDGAYTIKDVKHRLARSSGFITTLTYKQPEDGAGTDDRGSGGDSADSAGGAQ